MAHFAELDQNNIVLRVVVINDDYAEDGENWCNNFFGGGVWKQTSYNAIIRKHYAGIGYSYDETLDAFIEPQPYTSWSLNNTTCEWEAPVEYPQVETDVEGNPMEFYSWNNDISNWEKVV